MAFSPTWSFAGHVGVVLTGSCYGVPLRPRLDQMGKTLAIAVQAVCALVYIDYQAIVHKVRDA